jgi:hypothetical protein
MYLRALERRYAGGILVRLEAVLDLVDTAHPRDLLDDFVCLRRADGTLESHAVLLGVDTDSARV